MIFRIWPTRSTRASTAAALTSNISKAYLPDSPFKRYGDVTELKAEIISDDSALNGKKALFAKIAPLDELVSMVRAGQKVYTSIGDPPELLKQRQVLHSLGW